MSSCDHNSVCCTYHIIFTKTNLLSASSCEKHTEGLRVGACPISRSATQEDKSKSVQMKVIYLVKFVDSIVLVEIIKEPE